MSRAVTPSSLAERVRAAAPARVVGGLGFDWLMLVFLSAFLGGLYLDGWAHNHGRVDQSFFTPWHAVFYGGFALTGLVLLGAVLINRTRGQALLRSIPRGYETSLSGLLLFGAGGLGDMVWHTLFGIEEGVEALFSPTHLLLGVGLAMAVSGPLRAAWYRRQSPSGWRGLGPAILSTALLTSTLTFFLMFGYPVTVVVGGAGHRHFYSDVGTVAGLYGMTLTAAFLAGPILLLLRRWRLPRGAVSVIVGLNLVGMTVLDYAELYVVFLAAGMFVAALVLDWLREPLDPGPARPWAMHLYGLLIPILLYSGYFGALLATEGTSWSIHLWAGSIGFGGVAGVLVAFLVQPPAIPAERARGE